MFSFALLFVQYGRTKSGTKKQNKIIVKMAQTAKKIESVLLRKARRIALPHGGKRLLRDLTGINAGTIRSLLGSGEARPDVIEKLEAVRNYEPGQEI